MRLPRLIAKDVGACLSTAQIVVFGSSMLPPEPTISLQLYTIRNQLEENPEAALERIKSIGIESVEIAPLSDRISAARLSRILQSLNLKPEAIHSDLPVGDGLARAARHAEEFDCQRIIWHGWPRDPAFDSREGMDWLINLYNEAQTNAERHGLEFGVHNHWWEFEPVQGQLPYKRMVQRLNPLIFFEVDTYWVRAAGMDPEEVLAELGDRVRFLHLKDGPAEQGKPMVALGAGVMDFESILRVRSSSVRSLVIELDECATDIWQAVEKSFRYLSNMLDDPE